MQKIAELYAEKADDAASEASEYDRKMEARRHPHELVPVAHPKAGSAHGFAL